MLVETGEGVCVLVACVSLDGVRMDNNDRVGGGVMLGFQRECLMREIGRFRYASALNGPDGI